MLGSSDHASTSEVNANMTGMFKIQNNICTNTINWILDTGATNHMTFRLDSLYNIKKVKRSKGHLPNGNFSFVSHIGDHLLADNLVLRNVLYILNFKHNLIPISKHSHNLSGCVQFYPHIVTFQDLSKEKVI